MCSEQDAAAAGEPFVQARRERHGLPLGSTPYSDRRIALPIIESEVHAGAGKSDAAQALTKDEIFLALSETGRDVDVGFTFDKFTIVQAKGRSAMTKLLAALLLVAAPFMALDDVPTGDTFRVCSSPDPRNWETTDCVEFEAALYCDGVACAWPWPDPPGELLFYNAVTCDEHGCSEWEHGTLWEVLQ